MADSVARTALKKARFFLGEAAKYEDTELDHNRLPFVANLEAALVWARTSIDHLNSEFAPKYKDKGYRRWHDSKWKSLSNGNRIFGYFVVHRNVVLHQAPQETRAEIEVETQMSVSVSMSVELEIIRADGTRERHPNATTEPAKPPPPSETKTTRRIFLAEANFGDRPAIEYASEFIDVCETFVADAEKQFT